MTDDLKAQELLPCPFCGGEAHYQPAWGVKCRTCGGGAPCRGDELEQWNRRAALSDHPAVKALVAEAEARGMERAAAMSCSCGYDVPDNVTFDEGQMFRAGAETALDAVSTMLRAEAAAIRKGETT